MKRPIAIPQEINFSFTYCRSSLEKGDQVLRNRWRCESSRPFGLCMEESMQKLVSPKGQACAPESERLTDLINEDKIAQ